MPADEDALGGAHDLLERLLDDVADLDLKDRFRFETAVIEVLGNIVEHAFTADDPAGLRRLTLCLSASDDSLEAHLSDNGQPNGLDLSAVTMPDEDAESGRGLALTLRSVDDLRYRNEDGRNHWDLVCRRQR